MFYSHESHKQGCQIVTIFAYRIIAFFGCFLMTEVAKILPSPREKYIYLYMYSNFDKNRLGYILGDIFTNSSGHPGHKTPSFLCRSNVRA
jgi:hypothetical protein